MSSNFPRIDLGNGKFCYSGPTCKRHGSTNSVGTKFVTPSPFETRVQVIETNFASARGKLDDYICKLGYTAHTLNDLDEPFMVESNGVVKCGKHDSYHGYVVAEINSMLGATSRRLNNWVSNNLEAGIISHKDAENLRKTITEEHTKMLTLFSSASSKIKAEAKSGL